MDITDRVQAEQALQQAHQRKDEFLAMLAHELRNPLAPIGAAAELMSRPEASLDLMQRTSASPQPTRARPTRKTRPRAPPPRPAPQRTPQSGGRAAAS